MDVLLWQHMVDDRWMDVQMVKCAKTIKRASIPAHAALRNEPESNLRPVPSTSTSSEWLDIPDLVKNSLADLGMAILEITDVD
jgi:hypothetical protein